MKIGIDSISYIASGIGVTLKYAVTSVSIGLIIAVLLTLASMSKFNALRLFNRFYISVFRGTPLLIQLSIVYYGIPGLLGYKITAFAAGVIAFSMNSGAYVSEVIRAGINSIDKGQFEAAQTLGISPNLTMRDIILPQAFRNILPALVNEFINMLKESALVSIIGEADLMRRANTVAAEKYTYFEPLMVAGCCYYILVLLLSSSAKILERKLKK